MRTIIKFFQRTFSFQSRVHDYTKGIEYWERIEHVKPFRTDDPEWQTKYYY